MTDNMDSAGLSPMGGEIIGTCEEMCPEEERIRRIQDNEIHKLEMLQEYSNAHFYRQTMIKKFQKSSADHNIQIAEYLRTADTLLKTITYIEDILIKKSEDDAQFSHGDASAKLVVYLFIWDRYRMIAKDFTLQSSALPVTDIWIECHERMTRWMIFADHQMRTEDVYLLHAQQNGEQMNNLLKTLHGYYFKDPSVNSNILLQKPNQCEFIGYFVLFQIGNRGEVTKYLQRLPVPILKSKELTFAIAVWTAIRTDNFAKFFKLLKQGNILQKCVMFRYLGEVRLQAIKKLLRCFYVQAKTVVKIILPINYFQELLLFETEDQTIEFFQHCGINLKVEDDNQVYVSVEGQNIDNALPRDANGFPVYPKVPMINHLIENALRRKQGGEMFTTQDVCRGLFAERSILSVASTSQAVVAPPKKYTIKINPAPIKGPVEKKNLNPVIPVAITPIIPEQTTKNEFPSKAPTRNDVKVIAPSIVNLKPPTQKVFGGSTNPFNVSVPQQPVPVQSKAVDGANLNVNAKPFVPGAPFSFSPASPKVETGKVFSADLNNPFLKAAPLNTLPKQNEESYIAKPLRRNSKDLTSVLMPQQFTGAGVRAEALKPMVRQKSTDLNQFAIPAPPIKERVPSLQQPPPPNPQPAPSGKAPLPLLSATSVDEFIQRANSIPLTSSDILPMSRQSSISKTMSISPTNALSSTNSLVTPREPIKRQPSQADSPRLLQLEKNFQSKRKQYLLKRMLLTWKTILRQRQEQIESFLQRRYFKFWFKIYRKTIRSRDQFFSTIQSIDMKLSSSSSSSSVNQSSSSMMIITPPASSTSSAYVPPHRRNFLPNNNKRKPLRDYTIVSAEAIVRDMHTLSFNEREESNAVGAAEIGDDERYNDRKEGALLSSSSTLSTNFIFQSAFTDLCGLAFFLQQTRQYERILINHLPAHSEEVGLEQFIASDPSYEFATTSSPVSNNASSLRDGILYLINDYFAQTNSKASALFWPSDLYSDILLVTPALQKGLFVNLDCPMISTLRSLFTNAEGFFTNFRKKDGKKSSKQHQHQQGTPADLDDEEAEEISIQEKIQLLRHYQNPKTIEKQTNFLDLSKESNIFQLGFYHQDCIFQLQNVQQRKQYQTISRRTHINLREISFRDAGRGNTADSSPLSDYQMHLLLLSNYYPQKYQNQALKDYLQVIMKDARSSSLPKIAAIIIYVPQRHLVQEGSVPGDIPLEFTAFPTLDDIYKSCEVNEIHLIEEEKKILRQFFDDLPFFESSSQQLKEMIQNTMVMIKYSNQYYQKILENQRSTAAQGNEMKEGSFEKDCTVSIPILQYQLTSTEDKRLLQRSIRSLLSNTFARTVLPSSSNIKNKKDRSSAVTLKEDDVRVARPLPFIRPLIQRLHFKDFIQFSIFSFFSEENPSLSLLHSSDLVLNSATMNKKKKNALSFHPPPPTSATTAVSSIVVYQKIIETFFLQLLRFQQYYYEFIASLQMIGEKQRDLPPLHSTDPTAFSVSSYGVMRVFPSSPGKDDTAAGGSSVQRAQFIAVDVPLLWNHSSYYEKCEVFISNLIFPIEEFFKKYQVSYRQLFGLFSSEGHSRSSHHAKEDPLPTHLTRILDNIHTSEDVLQFGEELDHLTLVDQKNAANKNNNQTELFLSWKQLLMNLISRYNNEDGLEILQTASKQLESEILSLLMQLLEQRFQVLYPAMREYYSPESAHLSSSSSTSLASDRLGIEKDFDFLYYLHQENILNPSTTRNHNPFVQYCRVSFHPMILIREWEARLVYQKSLAAAIAIEEDKKAQKRKDRDEPSVQSAEKKNKTKDHSPVVSVVQTPAYTTDTKPKRRLDDVYDTPSIGTDWNRLLLGDQAQSLKKYLDHSKPSHDHDHDGLDNIDASALKKRKKQSDSPASPAFPRSPSSSVKRSLLSGSGSGSSGSGNGNGNNVTASPRRTEQPAVDVDILKQQLLEQQQSSKRLLQQLQEQLISWN